MGFLWSVKHPKRESQPAEMRYHCVSIMVQCGRCFGKTHGILWISGLATAEPEVQTSACVVIRKSSTVWSLGMIWNDNCLVFELIIWYSTLGTWNNICLMISVSFLLNNSCKLLDNCIYIFFLSFWGYYGGIVSWFQNCFFFLYLLGVTMAL